MKYIAIIILSAALFQTEVAAQDDKPKKETHSHQGCGTGTSSLRKKALEAKAEKETKVKK